MSMTSLSDLAAYARQLGERAKQAARTLATASTSLKNRWLRLAAEGLFARQREILAANERDLAHARELRITSAQTDRLRLDQPRIQGMIDGLRAVEALPDPVGRVLDG